MYSALLLIQVFFVQFIYLQSLCFDRVWNMNVHNLMECKYLIYASLAKPCDATRDPSTTRVKSRGKSCLKKLA